MEAMSTEPDHAGNPFAVEGRWYRGNLHGHSTNSMDVPEDRGKSPADFVAWYRDMATISWGLPTSCSDRHVGVCDGRLPYHQLHRNA